jgi:hypothetical protein
MILFRVNEEHSATNLWLHPRFLDRIIAQIDHTHPLIVENNWHAVPQKNAS